MPEPMPEAEPMPMAEAEAEAEPIAEAEGDPVAEAEAADADPVAHPAVERVADSTKPDAGLEVAASQEGPLGPASAPPPMTPPAAAPAAPYVLQAIGEGHEQCQAESKRLRELAAALGAEFVKGEAFDPRCTHMVLLQTKRTEKLLAALAAGCWLLRAGWVDASVTAGAWASEADWELFVSGEASHPLGRGALWLGAPRRHRQRRQCGGAPPLAGHVVVIADDTKPAQCTLQRIVEAAGGRVVASARADAVSLAVVPDGAGRRHALSREADERGIPRVAPVFLFELLMEQHPPTLEQARLLT